MTGPTISIKMTNLVCVEKSIINRNFATDVDYISSENVYKIFHYYFYEYLFSLIMFKFSPQRKFSNPNKVSSNYSRILLPFFVRLKSIHS